MSSSSCPIIVRPEPGSITRAGAGDAASFDDYRRQVEQLVADDVAFERLARAIDDTHLLATDQRAALWLLAWSLIGPDSNRARATSPGGGADNRKVTVRSPRAKHASAAGRQPDLLEEA
jgi:hypothetical protein